MKKFVLLVVTLISCVNIYAQKVGIGTNSPSEKLEVIGNIKADTLKPGALKITPNAAFRKVLTSDASGNATWQFPQPSIYKANGFISGASIAKGDSYSLKNWSNLDVLGLANSNYILNTGNGDFYVLSAGTYRISVKLTFFAEVSGSPVENMYMLGIHRNGSSTSQSEIFERIPIRGYYTFQLSTILNLLNQDHINFIFTNVSGTYVNIDANGSFYSRRSEFIVEKLK